MVAGALSLLPGSRSQAVSYNNLGNALRSEMRYEEALAAYQASLDYYGAQQDTLIDPDAAESWRGAGQCLTDLNRVDEAGAAFEAADIEIVSEILFPGSTDDVSPIVAEMMAAKPDILCWDTAYEPFVHALTEEAYKRGFEGQIISCTADDYPALIEKTSKDFMEGFVFQFPDFDDPALNNPQVNFERPNEFFAEFNERYPGSWSAVSWEYVSILDLWRSLTSPR